MAKTLQDWQVEALLEEYKQLRGEIIASQQAIQAYSVVYFGAWGAILTLLVQHNLLKTPWLLLFVLLNTAYVSIAHKGFRYELRIGGYIRYQLEAKLESLLDNLSPGYERYLRCHSLGLGKTTAPPLVLWANGFLSFAGEFIIIILPLASTIAAPIYLLSNGALDMTNSSHVWLLSLSMALLVFQLASTVSVLIVSYYARHE